MRTISFYTFIDGLEFSFNQDKFGERKANLVIHYKDGGKAYPKSFDLDNDEEAKKFLHGVIDGFFEKNSKQAEKQDETP